MNDVGFDPLPPHFLRGGPADWKTSSAPLVVAILPRLTILNQPGMVLALMTNEEKFQLAQQLAARRAFRAYVDTIQEEMKTAKIETIEMDGRYHSHDALIMDSHGNTVYAKCVWEFSTDPQVIEEAIARSKPEGQA